MNLEWTDPALESLEDIREYLSVAADPDVAREVRDDIVLKAEDIRDFPAIGSPVSRIDDPKVRGLLTKSYRIIYELDSLDEPSRASILAVAHTAQQLENTLLTEHLDL